MGFQIVSFQFKTFMFLVLSLGETKVLKTFINQNYLYKQGPLLFMWKS